MGTYAAGRESVKKTLRLFYQVTSRYRSLCWLIFLLPIGGVLMGVGVPFYIGRILAALAHHDPHLNEYLALLAICSAGGVLANRIGFNRMMILQARVLSDLHSRVLRHLISRSVGFHVNRISGKLISDAGDLMNAYSILMNVVFINSSSFLLGIVVGLVIVLCNSWILGLYIAGLVAITFLWAWLESRKRATLRSKRLIATKKLIAHLSDTIVNAQTVKTFAQEQYEIERNVKLNTTLRDLRLRDWLRAGRSGGNRSAVLMLMQFGMILLIVHLTQRNPALLGTGIFAFTYTLNLSNRLFELNNLTRQVEEAFLTAWPMVAILDQDIEIHDKPDADKLVVTRGVIDMHQVSFAYTESANNTIVFDNFNLHIKAGEKVGLVGPSGGGKSTLTRLLLRFDDLQEGTITIDGHNIAEITQTSLRMAIAYVPQEPLLFHRSIRENIAYAHPNADDAAIVAAAKKANAHEFIAQLPNGYDTIVGERGVKLSGGQRQRVAIARAILKDAPILVLDEATSALDSENEQQVQEALWHLMQGRTTLVIAHRLSTIQRMDRIIVLEHGAITEEGLHTSLVKQKGTYAKLWKHQSGGFIEE